MKKLEQVKSVYFLGIGGIGMSALARYFHSKGIKVSGYDKTPTALTSALIDEGISIHFEDDCSLISSDFSDPNQTLVVITPAIPANHKEWAFFKENGFEILKRSAILGLITADAFTIAVAGTHGKTTTSTLIAHLLKSAGLECTAFLGGISKNFNSNLLIGQLQNGRNIIVVEADEYDRSFLTLYPDIAVITSMDPDHLDIYGDANQMLKTYQEFASQVKPNGCLIYKKGLPVGKVNARSLDYALQSPADQFSSDINIKNHQYHFNWTGRGFSFNDLTTGLPGEHNVENAVAAISVAVELGLSEEVIRKGLASYQGVNRRFDYQVRSENLIYIDDYAHHPEELRACISSVKALYPGKKITGVFQPHLFSRTRDFADGFAQSLSMLDELLLLDIYPARELPIQGVTAEMILDKVTCAVKKICTKDEVLNMFKTSRPEVLLTLGAGDIDQLVIPLQKILS